jgi:hypothetical protein
MPQQTGFQDRQETGGALEFGRELPQVEDDDLLGVIPQVGLEKITVLPVDESGGDDEEDGNAELEQQENAAETSPPAEEEIAPEQVRWPQAREKPAGIAAGCRSQKNG